MNTTLGNADIVFVDSMQLSANVGPDCWGRRRAQPAIVSVFLHLHPLFLTPFQSADDLTDSVHYGQLAKRVAGAVAARGDAPFADVKELVGLVAAEAFRLAGPAAAAVRVVVELPKQILLAGGFAIDMTTPAGRAGSDMSAKVVVKDLVLPAIIGVNEPEREAKQRIVTNVVLYERGDLHLATDYSRSIQELADIIQASSYLTLERFVMKIVQDFLASDLFDAVTVRAQKPSALASALSSGVEITRRRVYMSRPVSVAGSEVEEDEYVGQEVYEIIY